MSQSIDQAFVDQFRANVFHLSQQKGSRLRETVRQESQKGKSQFFERLGSVTATKKQSRHSDTPLIDTPHSRRRVTLEDYEHADLIDNADKVRTLIDPASPYSQAFMWAMGRAMDDEIIEASRGNAFSGQAGGTSVAHPISQKLLSFELGGGGSIDPVKLKVDALRRAKKVLDQNDVDPSIRRYCVLNANQLQSLLEETEVTSSDFNTVKALVQGEINSFLGFDFVRTERIETEDVFFDDTATTGGDVIAADTDGKTTNAERVLCYASDGMVLSIGMDMVARIDERADKSYSTQVFAAMSIGSTRLEEEKVVDIACVGPNSVTTP